MRTAVGISVVLVLVLGGCVSASEVTPEPAIPELRPRVAITRTFDPTVIPSNRFGADCTQLAAEQQLADLMGAPMPFRLGRDRLTVPFLEALIQDGALACRWGEGPYLDGPLDEVQVVAMPGDRAGFDAIVGAFDWAAFGRQSVLIPGVGEAAWAACSADFETYGCDWSVFQDGVWIAARFGGLPGSEVDVSQISEWQSVATARADSQSAALLAAAAQLLSEAPLEAVHTPVIPSPGCASTVDWDSVAAGLGAEGYTVHDRFDQILAGGQPATLGIAIARDAAQRQGVRYCTAEIEAASETERPVWISLILLPAGAWVSSADLWRAPDTEDCHGWEGGPVCDTVRFDGPRAAYVTVSGDRREGTGRLVLDALTPAG